MIETNAAARESTVTMSNTVSTVMTLFVKCLSQLEFHSHFDDDVHSLTQTVRRGPAPLAHCSHRAVVQPARQPVQQFHVADAAVTAYHDLQDHFAFYTAAPRIFC